MKVVQPLLKLYEKSVTKQAKYAAIVSMLGDSSGAVSLDIGADNGVLSYLLRRRGGEWFSADLDEQTVESIRAVVGDKVYKIDGRSTPFEGRQFDNVVIIDFLEHIHTDAEFVKELARIIKPNGGLVVNVPHKKRRSFIRWLRLAVGLTDDKHGHVRPGYNETELRKLLSPYFTVTDAKTYSGFFVELMDVVLALGYERMADAQGGSKGVVITSKDAAKHKNKMKLMAVIYPIFRICAFFDKLLYFAKGHSLIVRASATGVESI